MNVVRIRRRGDDGRWRWLNAGSVGIQPSWVISKSSASIFEKNGLPLSRMLGILKDRDQDSGIQQVHGILK